jgi:DHA1 family inner membrane transport protein
MGARIVTAFCHAAFFGIGSVVAADLVPPNRRASAIALMFGGLTIANVLGVPLGTALGQAAGWRATFWAVVGIGIISAAAVASWLPAHLPMKPTRLRGEVRVLRRPQVQLAMVMSALSSASFFALFTYIAPLLEDVTGITPHGVTAVLLLFGFGITAGNLAGGRLADWRLLPSMTGAFACAIVVFAAIAFACHWAFAMVPLVFVWGIVSFSLVPLLQLRVVDTAAEAPNLPSTLNQGAFNLGNATGAWIGGVAITVGVGYTALPWVAAAIAALGLATCLGSIALQRRSDAAPRQPELRPNHSAS